MGASDYLENTILDHLTGKAAFTQPTLYMALSSADPKDDASGLAEPSGGGYARVLIPPGDWNNAVDGSVSTGVAVTFSTATGAWGTITHFAFFDALTGGNMLVHGQIAPAMIIDSDQTLQLKAGRITITQT